MPANSSARSGDSPKPRKPVSVDILDGNWTFAAAALVREATGQPAVLEYGSAGLLGVLARERIARGFRPAEAAAAFVSIDPDNASQVRFPEALRQRGWAVEVSDFRATYVNAASFAPAISTDRAVASHGACIAFLLGAVAARAQFHDQAPSVVVVAGGFETAPALRALARLPGARVAVAFFRPLLDARWASVFDEGGVEFVDLSAASSELFGEAVDFGAILRHRRGVTRSSALGDLV